MGYIGCVNLVTWLTFERTHETYVWESLWWVSVNPYCKRLKLRLPLWDAINGKFRSLFMHVSISRGEYFHQLFPLFSLSFFLRFRNWTVASSPPNFLFSSVTNAEIAFLPLSLDVERWAKRRVALEASGQSTYSLLPSSLSASQDVHCSVWWQIFLSSFLTNMSTNWGFLRWGNLL